MNVTYSEKARQSSEAYTLLQQATRRLEEEVLGKSAGLVKAEWDRTEDEKGRPLSTLRLSDRTGTATASFLPDELASPRRLGIRLLQLWGALLQARNMKQLEDMNENWD